jgi:uncharacterized protein YbjT (DUF2867 family)
MRVLVVGATGCIGSAVAHALRSRGHQVVAGSRQASAGSATMNIDFMQPTPPSLWATRLCTQRIEAVVNCVGILMPSRRQRFERVHAEGPIEMFRGAALAGVRRVIQVSALGVRDDAETLSVPYLHSKLLADDALAALPLDWAVVRPSLVYGPGSQSAALFATLASLPMIALPGRGLQRVQPLHVYELAEAIVRLVEQPEAARRVHELGGPQVLTYRDMLAHYRHALGCGEGLWLPMPMPLMRGTAWLAEAIPQKVFCRDTIRMLERGSVTEANALPGLLGRAPTSMTQGLAITAPQALVDLRVQLSPALSRLGRAALAFLWLYTAFVSALLPHESGLLNLLARCGLEGPAGFAVLLASCSLNATLGVLVLRGSRPWVHAAQFAAVAGYTAAASIGMPALLLDHCGPLVKNLPLLALVLLLWFAAPARQKPGPPRRRVIAAV